jgi:hypothetical protein
MVQNWENFMSPTGGQNETPFATGGASILAGFGIDLFARRQIGLFSKISNKDITGLKRRQLNTSAYTGYGSGTPMNMSWRQSLSAPSQVPGTGYRSATEFQKEFNRYKGQVTNRLNKKYAGTSSMLKGLSWTLVATGVMMMVEGASTPGTVSRQAMMADQKAVGGQGPMDSQQAYTQRQRALMAIHDSQLGIRNVIGNEAGHLHR